MQSTERTSFLDGFLKGENTDAVLPPAPEKHDVLALDPQFFSAAKESTGGATEEGRIGACGNLCAGCSRRGPDCDDHDHSPSTC